MTLTLLLDLDDTLLINDVDEFLPHYLKSFAKKVAGIVDPDLFVRSLLKGTQAMVNNRCPGLTLQEAFDQSFFSQVQVEPGQFRQVAEKFYQEEFSLLKNLTRPATAAVETIEQALQRGYRVAITTNPLFPRIAIEQRLAWANLAAQQFPFAAITSYETYHFTKPEPEFYAEVLARLGWPEGPVVAVGDDLDRDITAARKLGLAAYSISNQVKGDGHEDYSPTAAGDLAGLMTWLENTPNDTLLPDYSSPRAMLAVLHSTPAALDSLCRDLSESDWTRRPKADEWSLTEICCHLRDVETEVNFPRLQAVISKDNPFIAGKDTDRWAEERNYATQDGKAALQQFMESRLRLLGEIANLTAADWQRPARHAIFGPTHLAELVNIICGHDRLHIQQVHQLLPAVK